MRAHFGDRVSLEHGIAGARSCRLGLVSLVRFRFDDAPDWRVLRNALSARTELSVAVKHVGPPEQRHYTFKLSGQADRVGARHRDSNHWDLVLGAPMTRDLIAVVEELGGEALSPRVLAKEAGGASLDYVRLRPDAAACRWSSPDLRSLDGVRTFIEPVLFESRRASYLGGEAMTLTAAEIDTALPANAQDGRPWWHASIDRCAFEDLEQALSRWRANSTPVVVHKEY